MKTAAAPQPRAKPVSQRAAAQRAPHPAAGPATATRAIGLPGRLPAVLQRQVQALSGLDVSDVRVHAQSSRPARIGALAYTQGNDIHLGPGQEAQLPHEAWHVVQQRQGRVAPLMTLGGVAINDSPVLEAEADAMAQRLPSVSLPAQAPQSDAGTSPGQQPPAQRQAASGPAVVQRAVGFEFETGYKIERQQGTGWVKLNKMDVVKDYGNGIKLTADEHSSGYSAIEMVLDPPVQETNPKQFRKAVATFLKVANGMDAIRKSPVPVRLDQIAHAKGPKNYQVTPVFGGFDGNPQLTGGVRYDKLLDFMNDAVSKVAPKDPHEKAKNALLSFKDLTNDTTALTGAKQAVGQISGGPELQGLVGLLAMYLLWGRAAKGQPILNYAKLISNAFMARTDFGKMFEKLPDTDRDRFIRTPQAFVDLVLDAAGLAGSGATKVFERGVRKSDQPSSDDYDTNLALDNTSPVSITRERWLLGITLGEDRLSSAHLPAQQGVLMGLGALGDRTDRVGPDPAHPKGAHDKGQGIIIELRNMPRNKSPVWFAERAQSVFDYLVALNT